MAKKKSAAAKPAGTPKKQTAAAELSRCGQCGSTEREAYHHPREIKQGGIDREGQAYTHVVWRNTACRSCGQQRVDRAYENRPEKK